MRRFESGKIPAEQFGRDLVQEFSLPVEADYFLEQFNLHPFFDFIVTAHTCEYTKPYPHPIIWAARQMNVQPEECLMIGDTTVDIRAAKAAGAQSVGVLCGFGQENELNQSGADLILGSTSLLADILLTIP